MNTAILQCLGCDRARHGCMVRPNGKVPCPYYARTKASRDVLAARIAFAVVVIGIMAAIVYISL